MQFGIFYELQILRPWETHSEHKLLNDALAQVQLADRLGKGMGALGFKLVSADAAHAYQINPNIALVSYF